VGAVEVGKSGLHGALLTIDPSGRTGTGAREANALLAFVGDQKIDCDMLNEVGKGRADQLVAKKSKASLLADMLRKCGAARQYRFRELFIDSQVGRGHTDDGAYRAIGTVKPDERKCWCLLPARPDAP
jgi:hypothetical protein